MDCFKKLEAIIDAGEADAVEKARKLLSPFKDSSKATAQAVDDLLLDLMTLMFVLDVGREQFLNSARRLARRRLSNLKALATLSGHLEGQT